jgi:hypothetical protein
LPAAAAGNDGAIVHIGDLYADARSQTTVSNMANDEIVLWVASNVDQGHGGGTAIVGYSDHGIGVQGQSVTGRGVLGTSRKTGVFGHSTANDTYNTESYGVMGKADGDGGYGVYGVAADPVGTYSIGVRGTTMGSGVGVAGDSQHGIGVSGATASATGTGVSGGAPGGGTGVVGVVGGGAHLPSPNTGVYGHANGDRDARGVVGACDLGQGVRGESSSGVGVHASTTSGTALVVDGKAHFSRSGRATIAGGKSSVAVSLAGTSPTSMIFAVLASNRTGRFVRAVVAGTGRFTVYLNASVAQASQITWFVLD